MTVLIPTAAIAGRSRRVCEFLAGCNRRKNPCRDVSSDVNRQLADLPPVPGEEIYESLSARALTKIGHANDVPR